MKFGEKLQSLRKKQGWTQEELAAKISVSRQALSKWESGTATPDTENVLQISKLFGVSTDYLLNDEFESDEDIPAVQVKRDSLHEKYARIIYTVIGGMISVMSAVGLLVMGILSSIHPADISYPSAEADGMAIVKTGLPAFLELHHIGWLFVLCVILFFVGILTALYPRLRLQRVKK